MSHIIRLLTVAVLVFSCSPAGALPANSGPLGINITASGDFPNIVEVRNPSTNPWLNITCVKNSGTITEWSVQQSHDSISWAPVRTSGADSMVFGDVSGTVPIPSPSGFYKVNLVCTTCDVSCWYRGEEISLTTPIPITDTFNRTALNTSGPCIKDPCWMMGGGVLEIISSTQLDYSSGNPGSAYWNSTTLGNSIPSTGYACTQLTVSATTGYTGACLQTSAPTAACPDGNCMLCCETNNTNTSYIATCNIPTLDHSEGTASWGSAGTLATGEWVGIRRTAENTIYCFDVQSTGTVTNSAAITATDECVGFSPVVYPGVKDREAGTNKTINTFHAGPEPTPPIGRCGRTS